MLSESEGNSLEYLHKFYLKGVRLKPWLAENHSRLCLELVGMVGVFGHFCGLDSVCILSVVR